MTTPLEGALIDWEVCGRLRAELGADFARILGYFREDGVRSVGAIEAAVRAQRATALVVPAHTLKGEAWQFGAEPLATLAEAIEMIGRDCVERHEAPIEAVEHVARLRPLFDATLALLQREADAVVVRRPMGIGRRLG